LVERGANTIIIDKNEKIIEERDSEYCEFQLIFQEYVKLPKNTKRDNYAYEGCELDFRRGGLILTLSNLYNF